MQDKRCILLNLQEQDDLGLLTTSVVRNLQSRQVNIATATIFDGFLSCKLVACIL